MVLYGECVRAHVTGVRGGMCVHMGGSKILSQTARNERKRNLLLSLASNGEWQGGTCEG
jgi:hypothetical protein